MGRAISDMLQATAILISITLIAAMAIAGFVFDLFGSFTRSPRLKASAASCGTVGAATGDAPAAAAVASAKVACTMNLANAASERRNPSVNLLHQCRRSSLGRNSLPQSSWSRGAAMTSVAGNTAPEQAVCQSNAALPATSAAPASGSTAGGSITTSSATVPFSGTWL